MSLVMLILFTNKHDFIVKHINFALLFCGSYWGNVQLHCSIWLEQRASKDVIVVRIRKVLQTERLLVNNKQLKQSTFMTRF